jgi:hypothetical protein
MLGGTCASRPREAACESTRFRCICANRSTYAREMCSTDPRAARHAWTSQDGPPGRSVDRSGYSRFRNTKSNTGPQKQTVLSFVQESVRLGHLQRADLFSCSNLSDLVRLGRSADTKIADIHSVEGSTQRGVPDQKNF